MTFIDNLKAITAPDINQSLINNSDTIVANTIANANDTTGGMWFVISVLVFFIWMNYYMMDKQGAFRFELPRALFISSGWALFISVLAAVLTVSNTILPIIWFSAIFFVSGVSVMNKKEKNQ